ncbi:MAG: oxaloacetate decarboxylase [Gammaproteobacteria bacterium]|nr:MAG: oxaloacetate decarboxylase [Gammaproteobacteria bacterium]
MESNIINQGLELMLYGMGTVVVFLTLLVLATSFMSWAIARFFPEPVTPPPVAGKEQPVVAAADDATLVAVISAAIAHHRRKRQ